MHFSIDYTKFCVSDDHLSSLRHGLLEFKGDNVCPQNKLGWDGSAAAWIIELKREDGRFLLIWGQFFLTLFATLNLCTLLPAASCLDNRKRFLKVVNWTGFHLYLGCPKGHM